MSIHLQVSRPNTLACSSLTSRPQWKHSECAILVDFHRHFEVVQPTQPLLKWMRSNHPEKENALPTVWGLTMDDAQRPSEREMRDNSRSRSAILHVLRKVDAGRRLADVELSLIHI